MATRSTPSARKRRRHRDVVVGRTPSRDRFSVVARWPDERERGLSRGARMAGRIDRGAGGEQCDFVRFRAGERVGIEHRRLAGGRAIASSTRGQYSGKLLVRRRPRS